MSPVCRWCCVRRCRPIRSLAFGRMTDAALPGIADAAQKNLVLTAPNRVECVSQSADRTRRRAPHPELRRPRTRRQCVAVALRRCRPATAGRNPDAWDASPTGGSATSSGGMSTAISCARLTWGPTARRVQRTSSFRLEPPECGGDADRGAGRRAGSHLEHRERQAGQRATTSIGTSLLSTGLAPRRVLAAWRNGARSGCG